MHHFAGNNTNIFSWVQKFPVFLCSPPAPFFPFYVIPLLFVAQHKPQPLLYCCWGRKKKKKRSRIALLQPASVWSQPSSPLSTPSPTSPSHSKPHSITVAKSCLIHPPSPCFISSLPSPLLHSHPSRALSPVLIGKSVEPCQPQQWDTWSSVKTSFPVKRPPVLIQ